MAVTKYHQASLADLITIKEKHGKLKGAKLVYIGVHNNVTNSLIEGCSKTGVKLTTVTPIINEASKDEELLSEAKKTGLWQSTLDVKKAVTDADFVYTDTWIDMVFHPQLEKKNGQTHEPAKQRTVAKAACGMMCQPLSYKSAESSKNR
jgi:ornithine carbamoyltransferase